MMKSDAKITQDQATTSSEDLDLDGELMESYPLAEMERILEASDLGEEDKEALAFQLNVQRMAEILLQAAALESGRPAQLALPDHSGMIGFVREDHFHVYDTFGTGLSLRELTDEAPGYRPITLERIQENAAAGHILRYLD